MKIIKMKEQNCTYAEHQPEYLPLPAHRAEDGTVTSCWELSDKEIEIILKTKKIYLQVLTFNRPLQPVRITADNPLKSESGNKV